MKASYSYIKHYTLVKSMAIVFIEKFILLDYEHLGEQCWSQCGEKTGYCPQFCGSGLCCRQGFTGNGCNGNMGDPEHHVCVLD